MGTADRDSEAQDRTRGILLVGHGTRDADGIAEFLAIAGQVAANRKDFAVEPCFLELARPTIDEAICKLAERGVEQLIVMPLLLFAAGHAKQDVPEAVSSALAAFPQIAWQQAAQLGCHPAILEQSAIRFHETVSERATKAPEQTALVFVGRGSRDLEATQEMREFAKLAPQAADVGQVEVCFFAMAKPSLEVTLDRIAAANFRRVVVQPHLLFGGLIRAKIREMVAHCADKNPSTEWLVANRLGPTPQLTRAILERIESTLPALDEIGVSSFAP